MKKWRDIGSEAWILAGILLLAAGLRLAGVGWGIPVDNYNGYYHPVPSELIQVGANWEDQVELGTSASNALTFRGQRLFVWCCIGALRRI